MGARCSAPKEDSVSREVTTGAYPRALYKDSRLFMPEGVSGELPALVTVHGACPENAFVSALLNDGDMNQTWRYMQYLSYTLAQKCGVAVLMIGMPDDGDGYDDLFGSGIYNMHNGRNYSKALRAAIDHVCEAVPSETAGAATVDKTRIGLVGHSMGGGGVLYAAGTTCRDVISTVVALDPACISFESDLDNMDKCKDYAKQPYFSGQGGDYELEVLKQIKATAYLHTSKAQYNTPMMDGNTPIVGGMCPVFPVLTSVFSQLNSERKEIYVDQFLADEPVKDEQAAVAVFNASHTWLCKQDTIAAHGDGMPLEALLSFIRRHHVGTGEPALSKPEAAVEWETVAV